MNSANLLLGLENFQASPLLRLAEDNTEHLYRGVFVSFTAQEELTAHMQQPEAAEVSRPRAVTSCRNTAFWRALLKTRLRSGEAAGLQAQHCVLCSWAQAAGKQSAPVPSPASYRATYTLRVTCWTAPWLETIPVLWSSLTKAHSGVELVQDNVIPTEEANIASCFHTF